MKKIFILLTSMMFLTGCVETVALLGPASSIAGGGNIVHSSISSAASYGIKKTTGKSPMQHALAYAEDKNPNKSKDRCLSFVKKSESEACYIAKKQISAVKKSASKKIKNIIALSNTKKKIIKKNKIATVKKIKIKKELQLRSVETMLLESAMSKKQISHLRVSINKNYKINNSRK
jgi:hypothetical protein